MLTAISILFISMVGYLSYNYINYRDNFYATLMSISWNILRTKVYMEHKLYQGCKLIGYDINSEETDLSKSYNSEDEFENVFWFVQKNKEGVFEFKEYEEIEYENELLEIKKNTIEMFDDGILFFRFKHSESNEIMFKRIVNSTTIEDLQNIEECKNPFILVELTENETTINIQKDLKYFFLKNNVILDQLFLEWFIYYYYNRILDKNYILNIIDSEINTISLTKDNNVFNKIIL